MNAKQTIVIGTALAVVLAGSAQAALLTVANPSFEQPVATSGGSWVDTGVISGWGKLSAEPWAGVAHCQNRLTAGTPLYASGGPAGNQCAFVYLTTSPPAGFVQSLTDVLTADWTYTLTVAVGRRGTAETAGQYKIELLAGGNPVAQATGVATWTTDSWQDVVANITVPGGHAEINNALGVRLSHIGSGSTYADFDNVRLDAVPEPGGVLLVVAGAASLIRRRRRRRAWHQAGVR